VDAWRCLHRYNGRCQFFTWLCAILLNRYRNVLRSSRQQKTSPLDGREHDEIEKGAGHLADDAARPDQAVERSEQAALVRRCIQTLPEKQQQVIYLRFYVDDSLDGVAAALGCSVGTVKSRLFYALDRLRQMEALNPQIADGKLKEVLL
jgi:RNA polymerase sigma-70 factor (ECF subfamily)